MKILIASFFIFLTSVITEQESPFLKVGETAPDFSLKNIENKSVELSDLYSKGPVVLVVLRRWLGYQCPICT